MIYYLSVAIMNQNINLKQSRVNHIICKSLKRAEDIVLSIIILTLISPIMLIIAFGVKATSPGPIIYRQTRVTLNNKNFDMFKFRSMPIDTEKNNNKKMGASYLAYPNYLKKMHYR